MSQLTHLDDAGQAQMVDVTEKNVTQRVAVAEATISMLPETLTMIRAGGHKKGDVFAVARIAGIQAAKKCADLIPLCHPLMLSSIKVDLHSDTANNRVVIRACCKLPGRTGVEMEALTAASVAALTLYDMCKAIDKGMVIGNIRLLEKSGGKSGPWRAEPIPQTEPAPPTGSELQTEPVPRTGSELQTEPVPRTGSELQTEPAPPTESELQTEPAPHSESELQAEPASHVGSKARTKPVSAKGVAV